MIAPTEIIRFAFGMGGPYDIAIVAVVVVLLFGGGKVGNFGKSLGDGIREFKKGLRDEEDVKSSDASSENKSAHKH